MSVLSEDLGQSARTGVFNYMSAASQSSLHRNGKVLTRRDADGSDASWQGVDLVKCDMKVTDARGFSGGRAPTLERNGFELLHRPVDAGRLDFFNNDQVLRDYYPACAEVVRAATGARTVKAFDHNIRSASGKKSRKRIDGGQQVQGPAHVVHGDYTLTSAPARLRQLAKPPGTNDTVRPLLKEGESLLDAEEVEAAIESGRFAIINLWRNIVEDPVEVNPLALCDAAKVVPEDLVVFEIHYADRVGENYFAKHADGHAWFFYPEMKRDEALLIKQWDSAGEMARSDGARSDGADPQSPCTFSFHSAFEDPAMRDDAPDRWSMEVRCAVIY
ncbi:MAG: CmcJ/NvfI family oxidoreductase [Minwuia sp.]|uniref:CmcJ/NvfI family oxidoreductase n=1 Tax=Minwuia sp. TaxID=2493630 RepID=UPI003A86033E